MNRRRGGDRRVASSPVVGASRIRVLVVEDNRLMRDGLVRLLSAYGDVEIAASTDNASQAAQLLPETKPQVVLLDAGLANGESYAFLINLKELLPEAKTIVIDFVPAQQDVHQFIDGGANGFIMKDATAEDIVKAIRSVASGTDLPPPAAAAAPRMSPPVSSDGGSPPIGTQSPGAVRLTRREQEIKDLIAAGLGNKEIAQRLNIATNTVKSHVHNMLGKLAAISPPDRRQGNRSRRGASRRSYRFSRG
ncbi:MAG TPA: response regulator transcription factor [Gemmatimonadales bacterium]|nr:response regulator transcription factor [Gemmatimonadales bacterium]